MANANAHPIPDAYRLRDVADELTAAYRDAFLNYVTAHPDCRPARLMAELGVDEHELVALWHDLEARNLVRGKVTDGVITFRRVEHP